MSTEWYKKQPWADHAALAREDDSYAQELYAALCNMQWQAPGMEAPESMTWRAAGANVADMRGKGEGYLDFYCSGGEGTVLERVCEVFTKHGWKAVPYDD